MTGIGTSVRFDGEILSAVDSGDTERWLLFRVVVVPASSSAGLSSSTNMQACRISFDSCFKKDSRQARLLVARIALMR